MNFSLSKNPLDHNYRSFWSYRIKTKAGLLKKVLGVKNREALNILANCWGYENWVELLKSEKSRERNSSYFHHPIGIEKYRDNVTAWKRQYNIPDIAFEIFKFETPNYNNIHKTSDYIKDYLRSCAINAIFPILNDTEILLRKKLDYEYEIEGHGKIKGNFLYIEPHSEWLGVQNTAYFIKLLQCIWEDFPELMIHFPHFGIARSSPYKTPNNDIPDWIDWNQLPVVKTNLEGGFFNSDHYYYEYLILKPF